MIACCNRIALKGAKLRRYHNAWVLRQASALVTLSFVLFMEGLLSFLLLAVTVTLA